MEKFQPIGDSDIVKEPYKGTGPVIASAGYMYASHLASVFAGVIVAGTAAYMAHGRVNRAVTAIRGHIKGNGGFVDTVIKGLFGMERDTHPLYSVVENASHITADHKDALLKMVSKEEKGFFENVSSGTLNMLTRNKTASRIIENQSEDKLSAAFIGGGLGGVTGYIGSTAWGVIKGSNEGFSGKRQFERSKAEIKDLRETNDDLEKINDALHAKYVEAATSLNDFRTSKEAEEGKLRVSADEKPVAAADAAPVVHASAQAPLQAGTSVRQAEHKGAVQDLVKATEASLV